jgi:hypothetical protein
MEETRIVEAQEMPDDRVVLVARARDRVEAATGALEFARGDVERAREALVLEQFDGDARAESASGAQGFVGRKTPRGGLGLGEVVIEVLLDDGDAVRGHGQAFAAVFAGETAYPCTRVASTHHGR